MKSLKPYAAEAASQPGTGASCAARISSSTRIGTGSSALKQVAPIVKEEAKETVVITVYTFYF
jgi:hypothetical protein